MTAMAAEEQPKKKARKKATVSGADAVVEVAGQMQPMKSLHVVQPTKPKAKPGAPDYDWQAEYPGEEVYVYTVPDTAEKTPQGKQSPVGLTIGLAKLTADRAPNPGEMEAAWATGGLAPMWLFLKAVSSPAAQEVRKQLRTPEYNDMMRGWAKFAGIELSE